MEREGSPPRRAPLQQISRPDGGSPATPRKRARNGQPMGPAPLHVGEVCNGYVTPVDSSDGEQRSLTAYQPGLL